MHISPNSEAHGDVQFDVGANNRMKVGTYKRVEFVASRTFKCASLESDSKSTQTTIDMAIAIYQNDLGQMI